ncbi:alpha-mannosidase [Paenibacillus glycanilyticus]|uniref:Alpha-mannosidase n=1 Tax=Paenibacillus glycanilyticus TaxID=126569 RepID=A0ABQ6G6J3_9BACL|nr:alpha-mannosidase [Paenibacillus glycanilyticus]GLX66609.1 alpha-mannosidase [Paenibacillus glycanilyticus]
MNDMFLVEKKLKARMKELKKYIYKNSEPIGNWIVLEDKSKNEKYPPANMSEAQPFLLGDTWTGRDYYLWIQTEVAIPKDSEKILVFDFGESTEGATVGFESLLFLNGKPYQGVDTYHQEVFVDESYRGETVQISVKLWSGLEGGGPKRPRTHQFKRADLVHIDKTTEDLFYLSSMILNAIQQIEGNNPVKYSLRNLLNDAFLKISWDAPGEQAFYDGIAATYEWLNTEISKIPKNELYEVGVIGHTHIDVAWLWRLKHTREKAARSFSTVLRYMDMYPEYTFLQTQPQLYKYIKDDYPEIYEQIKARVVEGRWEADGAMWLEADCNIPSGESLTRQILHGAKFIKNEFNKDVQYLWLPDVFGYSWALPQILKQSDIQTFMTTKISWNQYNRIPHDTFKWRGIDGSEILTHFITTPVTGENTDWAEDWYSTYNGGITPETVLGTYNNYRDKEINSDLLIAYGLGDGGGGVTREMLENRRQVDKIPGLPSVKPTLAKTYFDKLHQTVEGTNQYVHTWDGELYLEYHRGTYTSQAFVKRINRKTELMLRNLEFLYSLYEQNKAADYPAEKLFDMWEVLLRNQFHDIIPGTSIEEVYQDHKEEMGQVWKGMEQLQQELSYEGAASYQLVNTAGWSRNTLVELPSAVEGSYYKEDGTVLPAVHKDGKTLLLIENCLPLSSQTILFEEKTQLQSVAVGILLNNGIETKFYRIGWNDNGHLVTIFDKENNREVLSGTGNVLQLFEDKPIDYDSWDIDIYYQEKMEELVFDSVEVIDNNVLFVDVKFSCKFKHSEVQQVMRLYNHTRRIDYKMEIEWGEHQQLLKVKFDVDVRNTEARYDIQYGNVLRPTHWNTSWDMARFETVGHQWADLSEHGYGVALLNDCKYGYDIKNKTMRLSLVKSGIHPDPNADVGKHQFTYSLLPHNGDYLEGRVVEEAWEINSEIIAIRSDEPIILPFSLGTKQSVALDAFKKAEDGRGWIVRIHNFTGGRQKVSFNLEQGYCWNEVNLVERDLTDSADGDINVVLNPYEINSFRILASDGQAGRAL